MKKMMCMAVLLCVLVFGSTMTASAEWRSSGKNYTGDSEVFWDTDTVYSKGPNYLFFLCKLYNLSAKTCTVMDCEALNGEMVRIIKLRDYDANGNKTYDSGPCVAVYPLEGTDWKEAYLAARAYAQRNGL